MNYYGLSIIWITIGVMGCAQPIAAAGQAPALSNQDDGPQKLAALLTSRAKEISELRENKSRLDDSRHAALRESLDTTAHQRDAFASGLYWFTDLTAAKAEAARTGRRILSLRLLGNLDEEYCCANSRFFRTVLYANKDVSRVLRERYVLHWKSVRPAPLLTIDMGDGRRIKRTITGNSIHYLLDAEGRVLDALPGIYSPAAFLLALARAEEYTHAHSPGEIQHWHGKEADLLCMEWLNAAVRAGAYGDAALAAMTNPDAARQQLRILVSQAFPKSHAAARVVTLDESFQRFDKEVPGIDYSQIMGSIERLFQTKPSPPKSIVPFATVPFVFPEEFDPPKAMVERPIMRSALPGPANEALDPASPTLPTPSLAGMMTTDLWAKIAEPFRPAVRLDEGSRRFMIQKLPEDLVTPEEAATGAPTSGKTAFGRLLERFEASITRDMVRNEYFYHTQIHQWLEEDHAGHLSRDVEALNRRVYAELFLTPDYDAWLGLVPEDTYTALEKDGCACDLGAPPMRQQTTGK